MLRRCILASAAFVTMMVVSHAAGAADAAKGHDAFMKYGCFACHGTVGQGGNAGPKLAPDPIPFDTLSNFVRTTSKQMPPYSAKVLPDDDLADIYAYLQSVPAAPNPKSIAVFSP